MVALNKVDLMEDEELLELVEMEIRELLTKYEFPGDKTPVVQGECHSRLWNVAVARGIASGVVASGS